MQSNSIFDKINKIAIEYNLESGTEFYHEFYHERKENTENINMFFLKMFEKLSKNFLQQLGEASNLYYYSLLATDKILDTKNVLISKEALLLSYLLREKSVQIMYQLFEANSDFWLYFNKYYKEYITAIALELKFNNANTEDIKTSEVELIFKGKSALMKACTTAMAIRAGRNEYIEPLENSMDYYQIALAFVDDLNDWKQDFNNEQFNYIIKKTIIHNNINIQLVKDTKTIGKYLFFTGEATAALKLALDYTRKAKQEVNDIDSLDWRNEITRLETKCLNLIEDIEMLVKKELISKGIVVKPKKNLHLPEIRLRFNHNNPSIYKMIEYALNFIIDDWKEGFESVIVSNYFAKRDDFDFEKRYYSGDIFQRAVICDILFDINLKTNDSLLPFLNYETNYILNKRHENGWWNFYNDFKHQPCDADTTAQVMQVLMKMNKTNEIQKHTEDPIDSFLQWHFGADGGIGTWFLPPIENCNEQELLQRHFYKDYIGLDIDTARDIEVMANFLFALYKYNSLKYKAFIKKGIEFIENNQYQNGSWKNSWYSGSYYGIYTSLRLLYEVKPESISIQKAIDYLINTQNADGGWGWQEKQSDPLNTSYALLSIQFVKGKNNNNFSNIVAHTISYLEKSKYDEREMNKSSYISFQKKNAVTYYSKAITYSYILKAILP